MKNNNDVSRLDRRASTQIAVIGFAAGATNHRATAEGASMPSGNAFAALRNKTVDIGVLIYPDMDQIDFTGPFEVFARVPNARIHTIGTYGRPFKDHLGLTLTPDVDAEHAPSLDLLQVAGVLRGRRATTHGPRSICSSTLALFLSVSASCLITMLSAQRA